jgi:hypothetical protein
VAIASWSKHTKSTYTRQIEKPYWLPYPIALHQ